MSRAHPRKPEWLSLTPPDHPGPSLAASQPQEIARVLEYTGNPASNLHSPVTAPVAADRQPTRRAAAPFGSTLTAEPAYKSALARLSIEPVVFPTQAATVAPLPSSRLDALLAGNRSSAAQLSSTAAPPFSSHRSALPKQPSAKSAPKTVSSGAAAVAGPGQPAAAVLSPVAEEGATDVSEGPSQAPPLPAQAAAPPAPAPAPAPAAPAAVPMSSALPALSQATLEPEQQQHVRPVAPAADPGSPAASPHATRGFYPDLHLADQLTQRIEQAKVQIRLQLAPMLGLSQALASVESDPAQAADALEAAAGHSSSDKLARRFGSCSMSAAPAAAAVASSALLPAAAAAVRGGCTSASAWLDDVGGTRQQEQQQQQQLGETPLPKRPEDSEHAPKASTSAKGCLTEDAKATAGRVQTVGVGLKQTTAAQQALRPALPGDLEAWIGQLKQQADELVRSECERLINSLHVFFDGLLASMQQHQQQHLQQHLQQHFRQQHLQQPVERGSLESTPLPGDSLSAQPSIASRLHSNPSGSTGDSKGGITAGDGGNADARQLSGDGSRAESMEGFGESELELAPTAEVLLEGIGSSSLAEDEACWPSAADSRAQPEQQCLLKGHPFEQQEPPRAESEQQEVHEQAAQEQPDAWADELQPDPRAVSATGCHPRQQMPPLQAAEGGGLGFGSPIKLPSQHPSPSRPGGAVAHIAAAASHASGRGASAESPASTPANAAARQQQQQDLGAIAKSLRFGAHPATSEYATPALQLQGGSANRPGVPLSTTAALQQGLGRSRFEDAYMTARSTAAAPWLDAATPPAAVTPLHFSSLRFGSTGGSWPAAHDGSSWSGGSAKLRLHSGGGSTSSQLSLTTPGSSSQLNRLRSTAAPASSSGLPAAAPQDSLLSPLLGGGAGRDLTGITASIRRMAAELRLKQGAMAAAPLLGSIRPASNRGPLPQEARAELHPAPVPAGNLHSAVTSPGVASRWGAGSSLYRKPLR